MAFKPEWGAAMGRGVLAGRGHAGALGVLVSGPVPDKGVGAAEQSQDQAPPEHHSVQGARGHGPPYTCEPLLHL